MTYWINDFKLIEKEIWSEVHYQKTKIFTKYLELNRWEKLEEYWVPINTSTWGKDLLFMILKCHAMIFKFSPLQKVSQVNKTNLQWKCFGSCRTEISHKVLKKVLKAQLFKDSKTYVCKCAFVIRSCTHMQINTSMHLALKQTQSKFK